MDHKIDLCGDRIVAMMLDRIVAIRIAHRAHGNILFESAPFAVVGAAALGMMLRDAIEDRTQRETENAREMVEDGYAMMGDVYWLRGAPFRFIADFDPCQQPIADHIILGDIEDKHDEDAALLCPKGRGYWQIARLLLKDDPARLRRIAREGRRVNDAQDK